jgi:hypothetical protein
MSARLTHSGLPEGLPPFTLLNMLDRPRHQLGLGKGEIAYLRFAFTRFSPQDFARGHICAIWYKVGRLADELGLSPRQICRIEAALERLGFILRTARHNRSRDGRRAEDGRIAAAWGINFAPRIERAVEIRRLPQAAARRTERLKEDRARVTALIREIRDLDCAEALSAARAVLPRLRVSEIGAREKLETVISALEAVLADFSAPIGRTSPSAAADENVRPDTKKKTNIKTCSEALPTPQTTPAQLCLLTSDGLREVIRLYASALDPGRVPGWRAIAMAARDRAMEHRRAGRRLAAQQRSSGRGAGQPVPDAGRSKCRKTRPIPRAEPAEGLRGHDPARGKAARGRRPVACRVAAVSGPAGAGGLRR